MPVKQRRKLVCPINPIHRTPTQILAPIGKP